MAQSCDDSSDYQVVDRSEERESSASSHSDLNTSESKKLDIVFFFTENNIGLNLISHHLGVLTNPPSKYS